MYLVTGLTNDNIFKQVLGQATLDKKDINETVGFIEAKEMTCDAITQPAVNASVYSSNKSIINKTMKKSNSKINLMCVINILTNLFGVKG